MTTYAQVVAAAVPGSDAAFAEFVLWNRTPYPMGKVSAQSLFKAASRLRRAGSKGVQLCDCCDRIAIQDSPLCSVCRSALDKHLARAAA